MAVRIQRWLEAQGFSSNPFEFWEADREATLSSYFIRAEWFDALCGDTRRPRSSVLFAPRGHGKSSHRLEIARICGETTTAPALIVQLTEYDWVLAEGLDAVNSQRYVQYVTRLAMQNLWESLQLTPARRAAVFTTAQNLLQLYGLLHWAAPRSPMFLPPLDLAEAELQSLARQWRVAAPPEHLVDSLVNTAADYYRQSQQAEILRDLVALTKSAGYASIYVLVDRVDEDVLTEHNIDATLRLLQPLLSNLHLIEYPGIAFKFFLPDHIEESLYRARISRIGERVPTYRLHWGDEDLLNLLVLRLQYYSRIGTTRAIAQINSFQDLCAEECDADQRLIAAANGSPRRLIMLASSLIETHCQQISDVASKISLATFTSRLQSSIPNLALDEAGYIWLDRKRQPTRLPALPRRLLELLWQQRGRYVSTDTIERSLYPDADRTPDALYKVVKRLRSLIEPQLINSKHYVDFVEGHGYRLCNYEEQWS